MNTSDHMVDQIEDLTQSLNRTSDVLLTADRMIDHYRNLNTEQETVIAKLKEDLKRSNNEVVAATSELDFEEYLSDSRTGRTDSRASEPIRRSESVPRSSLRESKRKITDETSSDPYDEYDIRPAIVNRKRTTISPRVRFRESDVSSSRRPAAPPPPPDCELELIKSTISEFQRKQESLEAGLRKNQEKQEEAIYRLDSSIKKQLNLDSEAEKSFEINNNLKKLQQRLEKDHLDYTKQQQDVESITKEMKSLKDVINAAAAPKKPDSVTSQTLEFDKKLAAYKRKVSKQEDAIKLLKEQLNDKKEEANACETTVFKMQSLEKLKSEQLKLLEQQLNEEKNEKMNLLKDYEESQKKLSESNKERAELLYHLTDLKSDAQETKVAYDQCSSKIPQIKSLLEDSEKQKEKMVEQVDQLKNELHANNNMILKLKSHADESALNIRSLESENEKLSKQIENLSLRERDVSREFQRTKQLLVEAKKKSDSLEASKRDLKEKAVRTLKDYRCKNRKYEEQIKKHDEQLKAKEIELSKAVSCANEQEIVNLKQKKELQQVADDIDTLQQRIVESENMRNQLAFEKCQLEDALTKVNEQTQINYELQREVNDLNNQNQELVAEVRQEKSLRQEAQLSLQEQNSNSKNKNSKESAETGDAKESKIEESEALKKQIDEYNEKLKTLNHQYKEQIADMTREYKSNLNEKEMKIKELCIENENLTKALNKSSENLKKLTNSYEEVQKQLKIQEKVSEEQMDKVKATTQKLRKMVEENKNIRKKFQEAKEEFAEKFRNMQEENAEKLRNIKMEKSNQMLLARDQNILQQQPRDANFTSTSITNPDDQKNDAIAKVFTILLQDSENLLSLLSHEEENVPNVKVVPHNVLPEHRRAILEIREKYQTCFSITKTLKGRFQQQKNLIKRAQEKIKSQMEQIRIMGEGRLDDSYNAEKISTLEVLRKGDLDKISSLETMEKKYKEKVEALEKFRLGDEERIASLEALAVTQQRIVDRHKQCDEKFADFEDEKKKDLSMIFRKDAELAELKRRISDLTRDLEGCTRALHKSIEVDKERKSVLSEIDLLKSEQKERQKIEEDYFRYSEKIELLTDQLSEAKNSLREIKQDSVDRTSTTKNLIETFGTVSPSRKRRLYFYDTPLVKSTRPLGGDNDDEETNPTRDVDDVTKKTTLNDSLEDLLMQKAGSSGLKY